MNRATVVTVLLCAAALCVGAALVDRGLRADEVLAMSARAAVGALPAGTADLKIDTGTVRVLRPRVAERDDTHVNVPVDGSDDEPELSLAERKANAKRVADASADAYRKIDEARDAWLNGN